MALHAATRHPYGASARPTLDIIAGSRGRPDVLTIRATELADLIDELTAAGQDMVAMASRLDLAYRSQRIDLIPAIAARLAKLGQMYRDCLSPEDAA